MESLMFVGQLLGLAVGPINITANINISVPKANVVTESVPILPEPSLKPINGTKLEAFRALFSHPRVLEQTNQRPLDAYLLPKMDAHQSEYLAEADQRVRFLSGFSGSNAQVIVTKNKALLWTDGRYFIQASKELLPGWTLMKDRTPGVPTYYNWFLGNLKKDSVLGFDPELMSYERAKKLQKVAEQRGIHMIPINGNLVDGIWTDRPERKIKKLVTLSLAENGQSSADKLSFLRKKAYRNGCVASFYTALDDIMWILNVRGWDIPHNPLAFSYLLITETEAVLFIDERKLNDKIRKHLGSVRIEPYDTVAKYLKNYRNSQLTSKKDKVLLPKTANFAVGSIFEGHVKSVLSPAQVAKGVKNEVELKGSRASHIRDSVVLTEFFYWLEMEMKNNKSYTEIELADKIEMMRSKQDQYMDLSFASISAGGDHSALPHYHPNKVDGQRIVKKDMVYTLDSGAHYRTGTTDVTRTIWTGDASTAPKDFIHFNTLVLKGHINVARTVFPYGITGGNLDVLARQALWSNGLSYTHGTGHGFGHYLNVHEGPAGLSYSNVRSQDIFKPGMFMTIEPGYYVEGKWGIRIENDYEVVRKDVSSDAFNFLGFEPLTYVPINLDIVDLSLLDQEELTWLQDYNKRILKVVGSELEKSGKLEVLDWLKKKLQF